MRAITVAAVTLLAATHSAAAAAPAQTYATVIQGIPSGDKIPGLKAMESDVNGLTTDPFILALQRTKFVWTTPLCKADSDGDGQTNGQELGDPCCSWVETTNLFTLAPSDPGNVDSTINLKMYGSITCTQSEEAVEARGKHHKTLAPKTKTMAPKKRYEDGNASSGSSSTSGMIRKASGQENQGSQTTSGSAYAIVSTAITTVVVAVTWGLL